MIETNLRLSEFHFDDPTVEGFQAHAVLGRLGLPWVCDLHPAQPARAGNRYKHHSWATFLRLEATGRHLNRHHLARDAGRFDVVVVLFVELDSLGPFVAEEVVDPTKRARVLRDDVPGD